VSIKQKRLQLTTKFSDVVVGLANPGRQVVPEPWSSGCEAIYIRPATTQLATGPIYHSNGRDMGRANDRLIWLEMLGSVIAVRKITETQRSLEFPCVMYVCDWF